MTILWLTKCFLDSKAPTVFLFLTLVNTYQCPHYCRCSEVGEGYYVVCLPPSLSLIKFSDLMPLNVTQLLIECQGSTSSQSTLEAPMFKGRYQFLSIYNCHFEYINETVFAGLDNLMQLDITYASNLSIHPKAFFHVPKLVRLDIMNSGWHDLSPNSLCGVRRIESLNLYGNRISSISEVLNLCSQRERFFKRLTFLNLNFNQIRILESDFRQRLKSLKSLSIKGNKIEKIQNGALTDFSQLEILDISHNDITQLTDDFLSGCPKVTNLRISNNPITQLPSVIKKLKRFRELHADNTLLTDISLLKYTSLQELKIRNVNLNTIPPRLCGGNSRLTRLDLGQNSISKIPPNIFENCTELESLDLSFNNISVLYKDSFKGLKSLNDLHLDHNNISSCDEDTFVFKVQNLTELDMSFNSLSEVPVIPRRLETIDLNNNWIQSVSREDFEGSFLLKTLLLANNRIQSITGAFPHLKKLLRLDLQHNLISELQSGTFPQTISIINLTDNQIETVRNGAFRTTGNLKKVDLRMNKIVTLSPFSVNNDMARFYISANSFQCDCNLAWLKEHSKINYNRKFFDLGDVTCSNHGKYWLPVGKFTKIRAENFLCQYKSSSQKSIGCSNSCLFDRQENCLCANTCPANCLCTRTRDFMTNRVNCTNGNFNDGTDIHPFATWIDLSGNNLGNLSNKTFIRQEKAEILYLNDSKITRIDEETFITFESLKALHLEHNEMTMLDTNSFVGLKALKELFLSHNEIRKILPGTFNETQRLDLLDLSYNNLRQIDSDSFLCMQHLTRLNLSYNEIAIISLGAFYRTPSIKYLDLRHNNLKRIDSTTFNVRSLDKIVLSDNPWSCKCEDIKPLRELLSRLEIDSRTLLCDQTMIPVMEFNMESCLKKSPSPIVYGLSTLLVLGLVFAVAGTTLYAYRIEIQILIFVRFGWRILYKKNQLDEEDKIYDAFVSYHSSHDDFVVNEMLPRLEATDPAFKLCVHFRDFLAGALIVDNITEAIENSKRTILLLNNEFLASEWCRYEFQAAHFEALSNRLNSLIVVLLEDINTDLVEDGGLKYYLKTRTYLRFDDPRFWDKLRFALPPKKIINEEKSE